MNSLCGVCNCPSSRLVKEAKCGHEKCRSCFIAEESGCTQCDHLLSKTNTSNTEDEKEPLEEDKTSKRPSHIRKNSNLSYSCTICDKTFARNSQYYHFYCDKSNNKPFKCPNCPKSFRSSAHLKYHSEEHLEAGKFACDICSKEFSKKAVLLKHRKLHSKQKNKCEKCNAEFKDDACFKEHLKKHENIFRHKCKVCNKTFNSKSSLKKHESVIHSPKSAKSFPCENCGKKFLYKSALNAHLKTHKTVKDILVCEECNQTFTNSKSLGRHLENHRKNIKYECSICNISSLRKDNIVRHLRNVHEHKKDYGKFFKVVSQESPQKSENVPKSYENCSVIKSVGNVVPVVIRKESDSKEQEEKEMIAKTLKKKYNKNYDLYREILMGGNDDDERSRKEKSNFSATHWRKKFKENHISEGIN